MTKDSGPVLSLEARRLTELTYQGVGDRFLQSVIGLATGETLSFDMPITLLVSGVLVRGRLAPPEAFAGFLDAKLRRLAETATFNVQGAMTQEDMRKEVAKGFEGAFAEIVETMRLQRRRGRERLEEVWGPPTEWDRENPPENDDLPDDLAKVALVASAPTTAFSLSSAEAYVGGSWVPIGMARILVGQIGAWWIPQITDDDNDMG